MRWKSSLVKPLAKFLSDKTSRDAANAVQDQTKIKDYLIRKARKTEFGKEHDFKNCKSYTDFKQRIPIRNYESIKPYIEKIKSGEQDVLWPGKPKYFAKTSGTTSGIKYIPVSKESTPYHINTARNALMSFAYRNKLLKVFNGKLIFMSGSPTLYDTAGIKTGRLSGIVNHEVPSWVKGNQIPTYKTNCIEDWEEKLDKITDEALQTDLRLISGIPPWIQMFYERIIKQSGMESVSEAFPNFQLFAYGGVNYAPYKNSLEQLVGKDIPSFETYPASEGFIAFQDTLENNGLLLNTNAGIFFEFIPLTEINSATPIRLSLAEVELDKDYVVLINSNAGLWAYNIGDTVRFVSKDPYRLVVSGRVKHFISAFGEHVIGKEVEMAYSAAAKKIPVSINEFTIAPQVNPSGDSLPYHEWFIEFENEPKDIKKFAQQIDLSLREQNIYYDDLISGNVLQPIVISKIKKGGFQSYMKSVGKLGGQNKVPRLSNDRKIADALQDYLIV